MPDLDLTFVDRVVAEVGDGADAVIPILQRLQDHYRYLPQPALRRVCELTQITPAAITGVSGFYTQFRHHPVGQHVFQVCVGTACHVQGAELVREAAATELRLGEGEDTDSDGLFTVQTVACLGCCTLAPMVQIGDTAYGHLTRAKVPDVLRDYLARKDSQTHTPTAVPRARTRLDGEVRVGLGSCCIAQGADKVFAAVEHVLADNNLSACAKRVGCAGVCYDEPLLEVVPVHGPSRLYTHVQPEDVEAILLRHFQPRNVLRRLGHVGRHWLDQLLDGVDDADPPDLHADASCAEGVCAFLEPQRRLSTEHCGKINPTDLDEYLRTDGFVALRRCLESNDPAHIIAQITSSGLRGRGGAGFPTGIKWQKVREAAGDVRYVICNGDEGDPGAFMDRMILESVPYQVIEGMAIAALAVGAREGFFYIRAEYPLAVRRIREALDVCRQRGWLGDNILGSGFSLQLSVREGAGAFVCGEETALIASIEGRRGMPHLRPPYPAESGLWEKPTLINNVETFALVPWIIRHGPTAFAAYGTEKGKGTKVFALAGKVARGGLIEVPVGVTIRHVVEQIGGGVVGGRRFKAVQIGGPSGGCVPAELADTPIDYEPLARIGAIMGSGGMVVLDDSDCMVDIARYFLRFTQDQSCGKCTFGRVGTRRMLDILDRICSGQAQSGDLERLEQLSRHVCAGSLCGLGKTAPNPILSTLRYFRDEYEAHVQGRCPAGKCKELIAYKINDRCIGCTLCAQHCPVDAIPLTPYERHVINLDLCTRCDTCRQVCPVDAVYIE